MSGQVPLPGVGFRVCRFAPYPQTSGTLPSDLLGQVSKPGLWGKGMSGYAVIHKGENPKHKGRPRINSYKSHCLLSKNSLAGVKSGPIRSGNPQRPNGCCVGRVGSALVLLEASCWPASAGRLGQGSGLLGPPPPQTWGHPGHS